MGAPLGDAESVPRWRLHHRLTRKPTSLVNVVVDGAARASWFVYGILHFMHASCCFMRQSFL